MGNDDFLYIVTDLNEEEILKLFMDETATALNIETFEGTTRFLKFIETEFYSIESEKVRDYEVEWHDADFQIRPNVSLLIDYRGYITKAHHEILAKTARFLNNFTGNFILLYDYSIVLRRTDGHLKLAKTVWTADLLDLIEQEYELVDSPHIK